MQVNKAGWVTRYREIKTRARDREIIVTDRDRETKPGNGYLSVRTTSMLQSILFEPSPENSPVTLHVITRNHSPFTHNKTIQICEQKNSNIFGG